MAIKSCLVTGGSGFLGVNLIRYLLREGWTVRSLDLAPFNYSEKPRISSFVGDIRDYGSVERAIANVDVIVHCAAALPLSDPADIFSTGVEGTRLLLRSAKKHGISRFVYISSTAVYDVPADHPIVETDHLLGKGPYGASKIEAEQICEDYRAQGLCITILRPKTFVGPERLGAFELLYDWAYEGHSFPVLGSGNNAYQLLDVEDLCRAINLCLTLDPGAANGTYNIGASRYQTLRQDFQAVLDRAGHGKRIVPIPERLGVYALRLLNALGLSPLYPWIYETASHYSVVSTTRLQTLTGFIPKYSNAEALIRNYEWYTKNRLEVQGRNGVTHRVPWKKGALRLAKYFF